MLCDTMSHIKGENGKKLSLIRLNDKLKETIKPTLVECERIFNTHKKKQRLTLLIKTIERTSVLFFTVDPSTQDAIK